MFEARSSWVRVNPAVSPRLSFLMVCNAHARHRFSVSSNWNKKTLIRILLKTLKQPSLGVQNQRLSFNTEVSQADPNVN